MTYGLHICTPTRKAVFDSPKDRDAQEAVWLPLWLVEVLGKVRTRLGLSSGQVGHPLTRTAPLERATHPACLWAHPFALLCSWFRGRKVFPLCLSPLFQKVFLKTESRFLCA